MIKKRRLASKEKLEKACETWNDKHGEIAFVLYWKGIRDGAGTPGTTNTRALILGGHTAGVYIDGVGFVALTHVEWLPQ